MYVSGPVYIITQRQYNFSTAIQCQTVQLAQHSSTVQVKNTLLDTQHPFPEGKIVDI